MKFSIKKSLKEQDFIRPNYVAICQGRTGIIRCRMTRPGRLTHIERFLDLFVIFKDKLEVCLGCMYNSRSKSFEASLKRLCKMNALASNHGNDSACRRLNFVRLCRLKFNPHRFFPNALNV